MCSPDATSSEAVFEEMEVKKEVFAELEKVVAPESFATNTSSSRSEMGRPRHPERVVGCTSTR
jgi:3-hydroxyacyl-CoA dehydrogenase